MRKIIKTLPRWANCPAGLWHYDDPVILSSQALSGEILIITEPFPAAARQLNSN
jgi:hypothetical protein